MSGSVDFSRDDPHAKGGVIPGASDARPTCDEPLDSQDPHTRDDERRISVAATRASCDGSRDTLDPPAKQGSADGALTAHSTTSEALARIDTRLVDEAARILSNREVGPGLYEMECDAPTIARRLLPGQFIHLAIPSSGLHLLRRPFSVYDRDSAQGHITLLYQLVGAGTRRLSCVKPGEICSLIGPVGRPWRELEAGQRCLCIAGGVGAAPLFLHAKEQSEAQVRVDVVLGAASHALLVAKERYRMLSCDALICTTDDGSFGIEGFCTIPALKLLDEQSYDQVLCCGPEALLRTVAQACTERAIACQLSLERRMACGIGACLSCVVPTIHGLKRACVDGPIFDAEELIWS